jgi:hypothetical protein
MVMVMVGVHNRARARGLRPKNPKSERGGTVLSVLCQTVAQGDGWSC